MCACASLAAAPVHRPHLGCTYRGRTCALPRDDRRGTRVLPMPAALRSFPVQTIVSTSLPTILKEFGGTQNEYTWVGVAYMLTQTACQPLYGRISNLIGRKIVLFSSIFVFALGSLLCGAARSMTWLIVCRGLSGVGGGGIVSSVWVITAEIVDVRRRAIWSQALSITWSCSAIAGPLLGGFFSVYLNIPICLVAVLILAASLHNAGLHAAQDASWKSFWQKFDFAGLFLFITGTCCIIVGFSFASSNGWIAPSTLGLILGGVALLAGAGFYESWTTREALFPPAAFKKLNIVIILTINLLHNFAFTSGTFYLALYYQLVDSSTPLRAGLMLLPYSLGSSLASMPVAWYLGYREKRTHDTTGQMRVITVGLLIATVGFGLLQLLRQDTPLVMQSLLPLVAGFGLGMLFHAPYQVFTHALPPHELATGTSAFFLVRFTGATVGLSIAGALFQNSLARDISASSLALGGHPLDVAHLNSLPLSAATPQLLRAVTLSIRNVWTVCAPCLGLALVLSFFLRRISVHYDADPASSKTLPVQRPTGADLEAGEKA
ncbi:amino acid permease ScVBA-like protein [Auriscalpium vulgare]|uniref:Amino acid permease ScVBA-like protein n=1 Tax=Auriscalpium vulgare TaxID=40419 RepID=A0ACB8S2K4_9AGAM|nr:amino acid permease ScVBA-like protein [Auriscalpium vulgare]